MDSLFPALIAGANPLEFALKESTLAGQLVIGALGILSVFSWATMWSKFREVRRAKAMRDDFLDIFRSNRDPLHIYLSEEDFDGAPIYTVYLSGCRELHFQLLGNTEVDDTLAGQIKTADLISPAQMRVVTTAMERAVGESMLQLESRMILLATAVSGAPFLGLLGTVWGVMDTFSGVASAGSANLAAMAPGVSAALATTVFGLLVAIPAMFGYNFLVTTIRAMILEIENFAAELGSAFEHRFVDHRTDRQ